MVGIREYGGSDKFDFGILWFYDFYLFFTYDIFICDFFFLFFCLMYIHICVYIYSGLLFAYMLCVSSLILF